MNGQKTRKFWIIEWSKDKVSVTWKLTEAMNENLLKAYTAEEVFEVLRQMSSTKALGPNGMAPIFFQKYWKIVGKPITAAILIHIPKKKVA